jgi:hypothetical protein
VSQVFDTKTYTLHDAPVLLAMGRVFEQFGGDQLLHIRTIRRVERIEDVEVWGPVADVARR